MTLKTGDLVKLKSTAKDRKFIPEWCGVLVFEDYCDDGDGITVTNSASTGWMYERQIRKLRFWEVWQHRIKLYYSPAHRIARLEKYIYNLESHIGSDYRNPLGTAFDVHDNQEEADDFIRGTIERYKEKIEKLKMKL